MSNTRKTGSRYEIVAKDYLLEKGYDVIAQNYRCGRNEIDLICRKDKELVFVEVKSSTTDSFGDAAYKINPSKQRAIIEVAQGFIQNSNVTYDSYRFDVVIIKDDRGDLTIDHREAAFTG